MLDSTRHDTWLPLVGPTYHVPCIKCQPAQPPVMAHGDAVALPLLFMQVLKLDRHGTDVVGHFQDAQLVLSSMVSHLGQCAPTKCGVDTFGIFLHVLSLRSKA